MRIGFDIGGTKIAVLAIDEHGKPLAAARVLLPALYRDVPELCAKVVRGFEAEIGRKAAGIGLSVAGPLNPDGESVYAPHIPALHKAPLVRDLGHILKKPVFMANDANCFALSEAIDGAAAGHRIVFGAILGTGVGGGLVVDRKIVNGRQSMTGEWGHSCMPWPSPADGAPVACAWGHAGCVETMLSGAALQRLYKAKTGIDADGATISTLAEKRDPEALAAIAVFAERLARALSTITVVLDPDVVVLGGSVSQLPGLVKRVRDIWKSGKNPVRPGSSLPLRLVLAKHGPDSGVRGAAWLSTHMPGRRGRLEAATAPMAKSLRRRIAG